MSCSKFENTHKSKISQKDSTEVTYYDKDTGRKIKTEKQTTVKNVELTSQQKLEEWKLEKQNRITKLNELDHLTPKLATIKSSIFKEYRNDFLKSLSFFEVMRHHFKLSYNEVFQSVDMILIFVFGIFPQETDIKNNLCEDSQLLICLWSWYELINFGSNPKIIQIYQETRKQSTPLKQNNFLLTRTMIASHTLGCILAPHIPQLAILMRDKDHITSANFPKFVSLQFPMELHQQVNICLQYNFTLFQFGEYHNIKNLQLGDFCNMNSCFFIDVDGPLIKLFPFELQSEILNQFQQLALMGPKI